MRQYEVAIVGNDAVLAALPSRPMQLAHALLACGFDLVVPVSWGEELVAEHVVRAIGERGGAPAIFCACPLLRARLLTAGSELAPYLLTVVSPAVATARYVRAMHPGIPLRITVIGGCPGPRDVSIDSRIAPLAFLRMLSDRGLSLVRQPAVFESVIPPDRRRFLSLPGGCPAPRALETRAPERRLVTITDDAFATELADHLLGQENVLIDLSTRLACACCGGFGGRGHRSPMGREEILRHEPPRARSPVVDHDIALVLHVGRDELAAVPTGRIDDDIERDEEPDEAPRLPGAHPIDTLRQRLERQRIAVTPAAAVTPESPRRSTRPPRTTTAWSGIAGPPLTPTTRPDWSTRAVGTDDSPASAMPESSAGATLFAATPETSPADAATSRRADVVVPLTPQREGMPQPADPATVQGNAPLAAPADAAPDARPLDARLDAPLDDSARTVPTVGAAAAGAAFAGAAVADVAVADVAAAGDDVAGAHDVPDRLAQDSARPAGVFHQRFRLSRTQLHPRVRSFDGQILPRAYIRHSALVGQRETPGGAPTLRATHRIDVELRLDVSVESASAHATRAVTPAEDEPPRANTAEPDAVADTSTVSEIGALPPSGSGDTASIASAPEAPPARDTSAAGAQPDALARLHQQKQSPSRVVAREPAPQRQPRDLGSLPVLVATAVLVVAILVFLAVTLR